MDQLYNEIRENWYPMNFDKNTVNSSPTVFWHFSEFNQFNPVNFYSCTYQTRFKTI